MSQETADAAKSGSEPRPAPALVRVSFPDEDWRERIARAKQAREEGKKARQGKLLTFRMNHRIR